MLGCRTGEKLADHLDTTYRERPYTRGETVDRAIRRSLADARARAERRRAGSAPAGRLEREAVRLVGSRRPGTSASAPSGHGVMRVRSTGVPSAAYERDVERDRHVRPS